MKYVITLTAVCFMLLTLSFPRNAGARTTTYPVQATLAGIEVETNVDSKIASQLINMNGQRLLGDVSSDLGRRLSCDPVQGIPDARSLREITKDYSSLF